MKKNRKLNTRDLSIPFTKFAKNHAAGIFIADPYGKILFVNDAYCNMVQKNRNELLNKPFYIIFHQPDQKSIKDKFLYSIHNDQIENQETKQYILWNGRSIWFESYHLLIDLSKDEKIIITLIHDVTERKINELELMENQERFRKFFKETSDAVFINLLTEEQLFDNYIEANNKACELINYSHDEILNLKIYDIIPIRDCHRIEYYLNQILKDNYTVFEIHIITKDKRKIPVEINAHLFDYKNKPVIVSVMRDITKRSQANLQLNKSREQLRNLALRLQNIREEERSMIAREIHDELGQLLTVLNIQVSLISKKLSKNEKSLHERVDSSIQFIDQALKSVQKITTQLRPGILDELGLIPAIEWQAREFEKQTGIHCDCILPKETINLNSKHSTALFRITQEALTNVARHSFAERVSIYLKEENNMLVLEITDNGKGIHESQINNPNSLGLLGIKERAMVFGGKVSINGVNQRGTNLKVEWPLQYDNMDN